MLDLMALYKLNGFHWHLTEDQVRVHDMHTVQHADKHLSHCCWLSAAARQGPLFPACPRKTALWLSAPGLGLPGMLATASQLE